MDVKMRISISRLKTSDTCQESEEVDFGDFSFLFVGLSDFLLRLDNIQGVLNII
jgi:hypothetical protein